MASLCCGNILKQLECIAEVSGPKLLAWYEMLLYICLMEALSKLHSSVTLHQQTGALKVGTWYIPHLVAFILVDLMYFKSIINLSVKRVTDCDIRSTYTNMVQVRLVLSRGSTSHCSPCILVQIMEPYCNMHLIPFE